MENRPHFGSVRVADWEMEDEEQSRYVIQLKEEFDSCDSSGTGCLNKEELTALCHKLRLETQVPLLLATLLGPNHLGRVNFEEFKEGFVAVLSRSLDISTSEEDTSYLEPAVPEEVKPKFVKGAKRYGRRSRPDRPVSDLTVNSEEAPSFKTDQDKAPNSDVQGTGLRRSTSLESVESIKSDEETGSNKAANSQTFEAHGQLQQWKHTNTGSPRHAPTPLTDSAGQGMGEVWAELGVGSSGFLDKQELSLVCESIGLGDLDTQDMEALFRKLDKDQDGRVSLKEFQRGFFKHGMLLKPSTCSTPIRPQAQHAAAKQALEDFPVQSTSTPLLSDGVSLRLLTRLDNGSGCASPECVITVWSEEGVRHGREILQTLSFSLDEALNLAELTMALDNELLVSENIIHQAALVSYKSEIQFLQIQAEQACKERDKAKVDLERAERRNLQLVREVDEHHATMETLNESKIKSMEQEYRDRLTALRSQTEKESEVLLQQVDRERAQLQKEVDDLRVQEAGLQEEVAAASQENSRLEKEIVHLKWRLLDSETTISRLQKDLDHLLKDKFGSLDGIQTSLLGQEDRFADIIREYEQQCRELRDKNDELSSELEMLRNQGSGRKYRDGTPAHTWSGRRSLITESDSDDPEVKTGSSPLTQKKVDKNVLGSPESALANMSIKTELAVEHLKDRHRQEVQDLKIELETKVNYYERSLELMRFNMEVERRDISQSFKVEISEQEEQRAQAEEREARLQETVAELREQLRVATQEPELEQRAQHERAELEQSYAREISNLVQKLTSEKEQLQVELQLKMDQELRLVREEERAKHAMEQEVWKVRERELLETRRKLQRGNERAVEEQALLCGSAALERIQLQEAHEQEVQALKGQLHSLEIELEERRAQLDGCVSSLLSLEDLAHGLTAGLRTTEQELEVRNDKESAFLCKVEQLTQELRSNQEKCEILQKEKEVLWASCAQVTALSAQWQEQLKAKEEELKMVRGQLEVAWGELRDGKARLQKAVEDKAQLLEEPKNKSIKLEQLEPCVSCQKEDLLCTKLTTPSIQDACRQECDKVSRLLDQHSHTEEMRAELSKVWKNTQDLRFRLKQQGDMVLNLQYQLDHEVSEKVQLENELRNMEVQLGLKEELSEELKSKLELLTLQLKGKEEELCGLRERLEGSPCHLQQVLLEAQAQTRRAEEQFEREKIKMKEQLLDMERLVMAVEVVMEQTGPNRAQLDEVTAENAVLKSQHCMLQQDMQRLQEVVDKKRKKLEAMEKEHEQNREEVERLYKENARHREESLQLSSRNLQLSEENVELSVQLESEQDAARIQAELTEQLSCERDEAAAMAQQLQQASNQRERELHGLQAAWQQEREVLEQELQATRDKLQNLSAMESQLAGLTLKHQYLEQETWRLQKELEERTMKAEQLQESLGSLSTQAEQLRSELQAVSLDRALRAQEAASHQKMLQEARDKVQELEATVEKLRSEKEQLSSTRRQEEAQEAQALTRECQSLQSQNQEMLQKVSQLQLQEAEVQRVTQESLTLKAKLAQLEKELLQLEDQGRHAATAMALAQSQHACELRQQSERISQEGQEQLGQLCTRLAEEQRRSQQLEARLNQQAQQASVQMSLQQEQYEKARRLMEENIEEVEMKLKNIRIVLQEKVNQLKEQLCKSAKSDMLLKELYVENAQLVKALQVTEQRQKGAERKNYLLEEKIGALNMLLRRVAPAAFGT
ncbi:ninein-like protein isoform X2 [Brienomyrus brachyistius]|uniref:ninein-like protein isoform X2 n=1 Tax=Brienomyrus brachyistius TaxID=42636 RepID=UPI0020B25AA8|nr:ninein-like protein isoform X2 [Brienomyrus brachyistius]